jgi:hypothetical protein
VYISNAKLPFCSVSTTAATMCERVARFTVSPTTVASTNGASPSAVSRPRMKYLFFITTHESGPGFTTRSPESGLVKGIPSASRFTRLVATERNFWSSTVSASSLRSPLGNLTRT